MLNCPKCGFDNELGRIFCHKCGAKLDLDQIKPPSRGGKAVYRGKRSFPWRRAVRWTLDLILIGLIVWGVILMFLVPMSAPTTADPVAAESLTKKRVALETKMDHRQPATAEITPAELNAYFAQMGFEKIKGNGIKIDPVSFQVEAGEGVLKLMFLGEIKLGKFAHKFYLSYTGVPSVDHGEFVFRPVAGSIGSLPIHPWLLQHTSVMAGYFAQLLNNLSVEKSLLGKLAAITVNPQQITLTYQPPA